MVLSHEQLLVEAYALGYLAHKLDQYLPTKMKYSPMPLQDNCFTHLMRRNGLMSLFNRTIIKGTQHHFEKCMGCYKKGYNDSLSGEDSKVSLPKKRSIPRVWIRPKNLAKLYSY